jgi:predicted permease
MAETMMLRGGGAYWMRDLVRDLRYALRGLRRNPLFACVAVSTLALGIGANTAIFSIADAVILRPLPVGEPRALVLLRQRGPGGDILPFNSGAALGLGGSPGALAGLAAFRPAPGVHVSVNGETELLLTQSVTGNYHAVLGVGAVVGRTLTDRDRDDVAVISHRYWRRRFSADPGVIGRGLALQGRAFTIVGVTPAGFFGTQPGRHVDVTIPLGAQLTAMPANARWLYLIGRLAPGVSREHALAVLRVRWAQLVAAQAVPPRPAVTLEVDSGGQGLNELRREFGLPLRILMAAVAVVLLVACANLAGLLIARASGRQQEVAVRLSLGASRGRIVRQLVTESALLAAAGGVGGVVLANWVPDVLLAAMSRGRASIALDVAPTTRTLLFAAAVTCVTALLFGLMPAVAVSRTRVQRALKQGPSGGDPARHAWGRALVATQVALLVLLLASAGLFTRTLRKLDAVEAGFAEAQVLVVGVTTGPLYSGPRARALQDRLLERFAALPGVAAVSMAMDTPPAGELSMCSGVAVPGRPADAAGAPLVCHNFVGPRFFETLGIPVLAGRDFAPGDDARAPDHVVISDSVARRYFPGENPLGRQIVVGGAVPPSTVAASIVGVARDVRYTSLRTDAPLMIYRPYRQEPAAPANTFLLRASSGTAASLRPLLRAAVHAEAPGLPPPSVVSLADRVAGTLVEERLLAGLSVAIAALAAILAVIGIYSSVAAGVAARRREIGIRMALGARPAQVARTTVTDALRIVAAGLAFGIPAAIAGAHSAGAILAGILFEVSPVDPLTLAGSAAAILALALPAAYGPARRASLVNPAAAIRYE